MPGYLRRPHFVPEMCRSLAAASITVLSPPGKDPTTRVRRRISRIKRSNGLFALLGQRDPASLGTFPSGLANQQLGSIHAPEVGF